MTEPLDDDEQVAWIVERTGLDPADVATVLAVELEYMATLGIAQPPLDYEFRYYARDPDSLPEPASVVDTKVVAADCEHLAGVSFDVAHAVLYAEFEYLDQRGLIT